jgi:hypothetical protein
MTAVRSSWEVQTLARSTKTTQDECKKPNYENRTLIPDGFPSQIICALKSVSAQEYTLGGRMTYISVPMEPSRNLGCRSRTHDAGNASGKTRSYFCKTNAQVFWEQIRDLCKIYVSLLYIQIVQKLDIYYI